MNDFRSRISAIVNSLELTDAAKIEQIKVVLAGAVAASETNIIERLVVALRKWAQFAHVNCNLTSERCPTGSEPSLDGARLETKLVGSRASVLAKLKRRGRRSATVAEGLLYGLIHFEELTHDWIWCVDQVVVVRGVEHVLVLFVNGDIRSAALCEIESHIPATARVLSFPMTPEELAQRDAEDAEGRNA